MSDNGTLSRSAVGVRPDPDPTVRTLEQMADVVAAQEKLFRAWHEGIQVQIDALAKTVDSIPAERTADLERLQELIGQMFATQTVKFELQDVKFDGIRDRINNLIEAIDKTSQKDQKALDAALVAAKALVDEQSKSSAAQINESRSTMTKQLDQQALLSASSLTALEGRIGSYKEQIDKLEMRVYGMEQKQGGRTEQTTSQRSDNSFAITAVLAGIAVLSAVYGVIMAVKEPNERVVLERSALPERVP